MTGWIIETDCDWWYFLLMSVCTQDVVTRCTIIMAHQSQQKALIIKSHSMSRIRVHLAGLQHAQQLFSGGLFLVCVLRTSSLF